MELERRTTAPAHATGAVEFVPLEALAEDATFRLRDEGDVASLAASIGRLGQLVPIELRPLPGAAEGEPRFQIVAGFRRVAALRLLARDRVLARVHARLDDEDAWALAVGLAILTEPLLASELAALRARLADARLAPWAAESIEEALARAPVDPKLRERFQAWLARAGAAAAKGEPEEREAPGEGEVSVEVGDTLVEGEDALVGGGDGALEDGRGVEDWGGLDLGAGPAPGEARGGAADAPVEVTPDELAGDLAQRMYEVNQDLAVAFEAWAELPPEGRRTIVEQARYVAELLRLLDEEEGS